MARIVRHYLTDAEGTSIEYVTDYSPSGIEAIVEAEGRGAILRAVYDDGTEEQATASQLSNPNLLGTGSAKVGASFSASGMRGGMKAQASVGWSGTVTIGSTVLEFADGLLVAVSQDEGGIGGNTK